jgi:flagellar assembly protein FliH
MLRRLALDDFDNGASAPRDAAQTPTPSSQPDPAGLAVNAVDLEEERLAAYEKGYSAGWEDAATAHAEEQGHISTEFARNLQDLSFTFHEAQAALVRDMEAILSGIVERVLPGALRPALAELVVGRALDMTRRPGQVVEIVVAPENVARVEALCQGRPSPPLRIAAEPSLGGGQAFVRFAEAEEKIDLDAILAEMSSAMGRALAAEEDAGAPSARDEAPALHNLPDREVRHG